MIFEQQIRQEGIRMEINKLTIENKSMSAELKRLIFDNEQLRQCMKHMVKDYSRQDQAEKLLKVCLDEIEGYYGRDTALTGIIRNHLNDTEVVTVENNKM